MTNNPSPTLAEEVEKFCDNYRRLQLLADEHELDDDGDEDTRL